MKQQQSLSYDRAKKRKILLGTLIPLGILVVATATVVPIVLTQCNTGGWYSDAQSWADSHLKTPHSHELSTSQEAYDMWNNDLNADQKVADLVYSPLQTYLEEMTTDSKIKDVKYKFKVSNIKEEKSITKSVHFRNDIKDFTTTMLHANIKVHVSGLIFMSEPDPDKSQRSNISGSDGSWKKVSCNVDVELRLPITSVEFWSQSDASQHGGGTQMGWKFSQMLDWDNKFDQNSKKKNAFFFNTNAYIGKENSGSGTPVIDERYVRNTGSQSYYIMTHGDYASLPYQYQDNVWNPTLDLGIESTKNIIQSNGTFDSGLDIDGFMEELKDASYDGKLYSSTPNIMNDDIVEQYVLAEPFNTWIKSKVSEIIGAPEDEDTSFFNKTGKKFAAMAQGFQWAFTSTYLKDITWNNN